MLKSIIKNIFKEEKNILSKEVSINIKGSLGEIRQEIRLGCLDRRKYKVLNNIIIPNGKNTSQIDHLVISNFGIFVIENKNFGGNIYGSEYDKNWTQFMGKSKNIFHNPVLQNYGHIKALEKIIGLDKQMYSVVVFGKKSELRKINITNEKVKVINETELVPFIKSFEIEVLTSSEVKNYIDKILESMSTTNQSINKHVENIKSNLEMRGRICPRCNSELVKREGKYGEFLGCSSYPKCRYIYKG